MAPTCELSFDLPIIVLRARELSYGAIASVLGCYKFAVIYNVPKFNLFGTITNISGIFLLEFDIRFTFNIYRNLTKN